MDIIVKKLKSNLLMKALKRSKSSISSKDCPPKSSIIAKSWHGLRQVSSYREQEETKNRKRRNQVAPEGCFSVYVGPEKKRFVVRTEFANHPLFKMLLEEAESEYGFNNEDPILLPCDVELFNKVLAEMDSCDESASPTCSSLVLRSYWTPTRLGRKHYGHNAYTLLCPSRMLKLNTF